jgi:hypothetical protein
MGFQRLSFSVALPRVRNVSALEAAFDGVSGHPQASRGDAADVRTASSSVAASLLGLKTQLDC